MDLFTLSAEKSIEKTAPLADRMRPRVLDDFIGQSHIIDKDKLLYRAIIADKLRSVIFYGPPGTGKTTLAKIIANTTKMHFEQLNAVTSGVKEIREVIKGSKERLGMYINKTVLFIDEIHRFNKSQQDALLPSVENGTVILIGATTENPFFEVNKALISRSLIFELKSLTTENIKEIIYRALRDKEKGLGNLNIEVSLEALEHFANVCSGDARVALNGLELGVLTTNPNDRGVILINKEVAEECVQKKFIQYDKDGDEHYNTISAFIKSIRGSDPDATLYWLAKMIHAGEDPKFISRRIIISASEDIGNADPNALNVAVSAFNAVSIIGMPEGRIPLSQAAVYMACAPKSNACYSGINMALKEIKEDETGKVPNHLKDKSYKSASKLGHGIGYKYVHNYSGNFVKQQYLPDNKVDKKYYNPTENGYEKFINERLKKLYDK